MARSKCMRSYLLVKLWLSACVAALTGFLCARLEQEDGGPLSSVLWAELGVAFFGLVMTLLWAVSAAGVDFGDVDIGGSAFRTAVDVAFSVPHILIMVVFVWQLDIYGNDDTNSRAMMVGFGILWIVSMMFVCIWCRRGGPQAAALEVALRIIVGIWQKGPATTFITVGIPFFLTLVGAVLSMHSRYSHDRSLMFFMGSCVATGNIGGQLWGRGQGPGPFVFSIFACYVTALFSRRKRRLPPGLEDVRFVRLGYLRKMKRLGMPIQQCQLMPPEAFGDARKASHLLAVSHRWIDRFTCDVPTNDCPEGFRLGSMVEHIDAFFSPAGHTGWSLRRFRNAFFTGGWDVLVFLDFMSLPQNGETRLRTEDEQLVFDRCLDNMGVLYSVCPVLVLSEVPPGAHGYFESGWCFCEFTIAMLGKQLRLYSADILSSSDLMAQQGVDMSRNSLCLDFDDAQGFLIYFSAQLETKHFFIKADAPRVINIAVAFVLKRLLLDAILAQDVAKVRGVLGDLAKEHLLQMTLDQPVDASLDTALHVAVRVGAVDVTEMLMHFGAKTSLRNHRGDRPAEFFMWPRLGRAAQMCRQRSYLMSEQTDPDCTFTESGSTNSLFSNTDSKLSGSSFSDDLFWSKMRHLDAACADAYASGAAFSTSL